MTTKLPEAPECSHHFDSRKGRNSLAICADDTCDFFCMGCGQKFIRETPLTKVELHPTFTYAIALQRAIEHHCRGVEIPPTIVDECPHHAALLNKVTKAAGEMREALEFAELALTDWAHTYAADQCPDAAGLSWSRIEHRGGALAYIAEALRAVRAAITKGEQQEGK